MDRQKMLIIFGVAWISAALLTWFLYAKTKAPKTEKTVRIVAAVSDLPAGARLRKEDLKLVSVLEREVPKAALLNPGEAVGRALIYPVSANEPVTSARLSSLAGAEGAAAIIEPGQRAISVPFTDSSGASGLIQPKSRVDVLFTRTGSAIEAMTLTILEDVEVLSVGRMTQVDAAAAKGGAAPASGATRTATLVLTPEQAQKLELAKNQGRISLSLRNPLDRSVRKETAAATMETLDPLLVVRSGGRRPPRLSGDIRDRKAWAALIGEETEPAKPKPPEPKKEPPKPRWVVDVFRGDKHVQDIFQ